MTGLSKYEGKDRRRERLRNEVAHDLHSPKYHQRVVPNKKHKADRFYEEEIEYHDWND
jgi:hypothetical protein